MIEIVDADRQPTGDVLAAGPAGQAPASLATTTDVQQAVAVTTTPTSLAGAGGIGLTRALHSGGTWHAEPGQTSLSIAEADWPQGGELSVINHAGGLLPITVGAGMTGYLNVKGAAAVSGPITVAILAPLERAIIQVKDGAFVNVARIGGGGWEEAWAALTIYPAGAIVRAPAAVGTIGIGDRIMRNAAGTSGLSFNAGEAANWTELTDDPDAMLLSGDQTVAGKKTFSTLPEVAADATTANQVVRKSQHDTALSAKANSSHAHAQSDVTDLSTALTAKQDVLVSGNNVKTVNGQSVLGSGDIALSGGQTGTVYKQYGDADVQGNAVVDTTSADAIAQPTISLTALTVSGSAFSSAISETHRGTKWEENAVMGAEDTGNKTSRTFGKAALGTSNAVRAAYIDSNGNQSKRSTAVTVGGATSESVAMNAGYPTDSVARTFTSSIYALALTNIKVNSFTSVVMGGASVGAGNGTMASQYVANTLNTGVANEVSCWFAHYDGTYTKAVKAKFTVSGGVVSIILTEAAYWTGNVLASASWTTSGGTPAGKSASAIASSQTTLAYGLASLTMNFQQ